MTFNPGSIGFWLTRRAELTPNRIAIDFEDHEITYSELNERANRAASALSSLGVEKGDRVAVLSDNRPEYIEVFFACAKTGAVVVPVSWRLAEEEIRWQIEDSEPKVLVAAPEWAEIAGRIFIGPTLALDARLGGPTPREVPFSGSERVSMPIDSRLPESVSRASYEGAVAEASGDEPHDTNSFTDPLMILYTSGTTGRPKGAVLTHGNFFWANLNFLLGADMTSDEVSLVLLPMFHIGGWNINTLAVFLKGGTVVLERQFDVARALDLIPKKGVTLLMGVPATYLFMSQEPGFEQADFSSLRTMVVGGAPMPEALLETYSARGIDIVQGYGLTELAPNALMLPKEDARRKAGSAGKPYFFADTRLIDDNDEIVGSGVGEIVGGGPVVMKEYWRRPDATAETIRQGWLHTGDVARVDEEGYFYVVDRKKDMIISGGENIYPAEIENVIYEHPGVSEAAVIGIPNERWGESVHAFVVPKEAVELQAEDVIEHCRARLAKFKVPRSVKIRTEPLPRTPAGKVRKPELRARFWEGQDKKI